MPQFNLFYHQFKYQGPEEQQKWHCLISIFVTVLTITVCDHHSRVHAVIVFIILMQFVNNLILSTFVIAEIKNATAKDGKPPSAQLELTSNYYNGFSDCIKEVFHCLTNVEAMDLEQPCFQRLMGHLQNELQFMREPAEGGGSENNHKDNQNNKCQSATSKENISSLPPSKSCHESWRHKRTHENSENSSIEHETSSENPVAKRPHLDSDKNSCSDGNGSSTSTESVSSSIKKEKRKVSLGTGCTSWDGNKGAHSNTGGSSVGSDKEKEAIPSSLKQDGSNIFDRANIDGGGCGPESAAVNCNWPNLGLDMPIQATPLLPRTPYMHNPYTIPTYALHPSGTHFIPVVLHLSFPLPPFPEMNGRLNSVPNWYFTALNYMRMGHPQFPSFSTGFPFAPQVNGMVGLNGLQNTKNESVQKQCESKPRDIDSTNIGHEPSTVNDSATRDLLTNV